MVAFRKANRALVRGNYTLIEANNPQVYAYWREDDRQKFLIALNFSQYTTEFSPGIDGEELETVLGNYTDYRVLGKTNRLRPYEALIFKRR